MKRRKTFTRIFWGYLAVGSISFLTSFIIALFYIYNSTSMDLEQREMAFAYFLRNLSVSSLIMFIVIALGSFYLSRKISRPIELLEKRTREGLLEGSSSLYLSDFNTDEVSRLAKVIEELHSHLHNRIAKVTTQKNEQEAIFMSLSEAVFAISSGRKVKRMNRQAKKLFSIEDQFKKDMNIEDISREPQWLQFIADGIEQKEILETELKIESLNNRVFRMTSAPYINVRSEAIGIVLLMADITRLRSLEEHRNEFVGNVSHELRTPLTSIQGYAETLLNPLMEKESQKREEFVRKILDNASRLRIMVEDLLFLASLDQSKELSASEKSSVGINNLVKSALDILRVKIADSKIEIYESYQVKASFQFNEGLMLQVFVNLIDNAIKYRADSKKIDLRFYQDINKQWIFEVQDYGLGIEEKDQEKLFERFYRVNKDRSRSTGGSGLGLSIVKNILDLHNIKIELHSQKSMGSSFKLIIPKDLYIPAKA